MEEEMNRRIGSRMGSDGVPVGRSIATPVQDTRRAEIVVPPAEVIPIVFVPGIMGSNLRNRESGESVWNASTVLTLAWQWAFRSAKTRQAKLDPAAVEVDPDGKLPKVGRYAGDDGQSVRLGVEQLRERGWGGVSRAGYGDFMAWLEPALNSGAANPWDGLAGGAGGNGNGEARGGPEAWGAQKPFSPLTGEEADRAWSVQCPLYGVGYNWLQSNGKSALDLVARMDEIIAEWRDREAGGARPYRCERVILVTHSMGGLVARAAIHPAYGNAEDRILGISHGVMPADGAAASYHHVRSGYDGFSRFVLGKDAAQVTAIFANACGPLELLPNKLYGGGWLKIVSKRESANEEFFTLPKDSPYTEIYSNREAWWRLIDPDLIDPAGSARDQKKVDGKECDPWLDVYAKKLVTADQFHAEIGRKYHARTYAHYGADPKRASYSSIVWATKDLITLSTEKLQASPPVNATGFSALKLALTPAKDDSDPARVAQDEGCAVFEIADAAEPGDGTVPENSGAGPFARGGGDVRQSFRLTRTSKGHAGSYDDENVQQITLYSIGKIIAEVAAE